MTPVILITLSGSGNINRLIIMHIIEIIIINKLTVNTALFFIIVSSKWITLFSVIALHFCVIILE